MRVHTERMEHHESVVPPVAGFEPRGDAVCWLESVCDECGALVEGQLPAECWRCGAQVSRP